MPYKQFSYSPVVEFLQVHPHSKPLSRGTSKSISQPAGHSLGLQESWHLHSAQPKAFTIIVQLYPLQDDCAQARSSVKRTNK